MPSDVYEDGSPRYDHGHDPATGETWWAASDDPDARGEPVLALLTEQQGFTGRDGRRFERWVFVAWLRGDERHYALEVTGVTGTRGRRRDAWRGALSGSGWCRVSLTRRGERLSVDDVLPVWRLSDERLLAYMAEADAASVDLIATAEGFFDDLLPGGKDAYQALLRHNRNVGLYAACDGSCALAECRRLYFDEAGLTVQGDPSMPVVQTLRAPVELIDLPVEEDYPNSAWGTD